MSQRHLTRKPPAVIKFKPPNDGVNNERDAVVMSRGLNVQQNHQPQPTAAADSTSTNIRHSKPCSVPTHNRTRDWCEHHSKERPMVSRRETYIAVRVLNKFKWPHLATRDKATLQNTSDISQTLIQTCHINRSAKARHKRRRKRAFKARESCNYAR